MRVVVTLLAVIAVLVWAGIAVRKRSRDVSSVLFGFAGVVALMLAAAIFGLY